jgi:hypothetical protein
VAGISSNWLLRDPHDVPKSFQRAFKKYTYELKRMHAIIVDLLFNINNKQKSKQQCEYMYFDFDAICGSKSATV